MIAPALVSVLNTNEMPNLCIHSPFNLLHNPIDTFAEKHLYVKPANFKNYKFGVYVIPVTKYIFGV